YYWTMVLNLQRYGQYGKSPYLGLGNFRLARWWTWSYSELSLYLFWKANNVVVLGSLLGWWLVHLVWIRGSNPGWVLAVMSLAIVSTTFLASIARQNYNVIGWMFFPLGLYGLLTQQWVVAGLAWFAASFGSFTVVFWGAILSLITAMS